MVYQKKLERGQEYVFVSQVIEDRGMERGIEKGIEKGILIYRTLLETKSIQQTAVKTKEPADKVKQIEEQYQVEVLE